MTGKYEKPFKLDMPFDEALTRFARRLPKERQMHAFLVTYDSVKEKGGHDYQPLWDEMKSLDGIRTQKSVWLLNTDKTAREVLQHLIQFTDKDDRILVVEISKGRYSFSKAFAGTNAWFKANV